jgi:hypothetical protein
VRAPSLNSVQQKHLLLLDLIKPRLPVLEAGHLKLAGPEKVVMLEARERSRTHG